MNNYEIKYYTAESVKELTTELEKAKEEYTKAGEESAKNMAEGFKYTAQAITNAGIAVSVFGGILGSLGFEEAGESVSWFGNLLTMVGTAASAIIPVIKTVSGVLVKGGLSAMAAWWWAVAIVAVIAALIVGIMAIANHVKNSSPEEKLKKAEEATKKSEDAANKAAEAYENLVESFDGLANKYKELENLTRGTEEWREAVANVNNEVLSLIEKYPDLIAVMDNVDVVLTLDLESDTAKEILQQTENAKIQALSNVAAARAIATGARMDVAYSDLSKQAESYVSYERTGKFVSDNYTETRNGVNRGKVVNSGGYGNIELF
jgi:tetratricopeptide (TPR) repeat protein